MNAIELLIQDHQMVRGLFQKFQYRRAQNQQIEGRSEMTKAELAEAVGS